MEITQELKRAIVNDINSIKSVNVNYCNGETISGFIKTAKFIPLEVTLCKHTVNRGENSYHYLDFNRAIKISLIYHNGETKIYE